MELGKAGDVKEAEAVLYPQTSGVFQGKVIFATTSLEPRMILFQLTLS